MDRRPDANGILAPDLVRRISARRGLLYRIVCAGYSIGYQGQVSVLHNLAARRSRDMRTEKLARSGSSHSWGRLSARAHAMPGATPR